MHVTMLNDRPFGDTGLYSLLRTDLGFDFVLRFRGSIQIENGDGEHRCARDWVPNTGQARRIDDARVTHEKCREAGVVCVKRAGMKDSWCLATSRKGAPEVIVALYAGRFDIEHTFRDPKGWRFGAGLYYTSLGTPGRRDRVLLAFAFARLVSALPASRSVSTGSSRRTPRPSARIRSCGRAASTWAALPEPWSPTSPERAVPSGEPYAGIPNLRAFQRAAHGGCLSLCARRRHAPLVDKAPR